MISTSFLLVCKYLVLAQTQLSLEFYSFSVCRYLPQLRMISPKSLPNGIICLFASFVFLLFLYRGLLLFLLILQIFDPASRSAESYLILIRVFPALLVRSNLFVLFYFAYYLFLYFSCIFFVLPAIIWSCMNLGRILSFARSPRMVDFVFSILFCI